MILTLAPDLQPSLSIALQGHAINALVTANQGNEFESRFISRHGFHYYVIIQQR